ncbi:RDD [Syntrophomonas zehnderi OL-4]|uniref:RDD n=1 Tax=Syntrophomonas zehnderi OL-4 TaxID=690567 RepID=A0A0E4GEF0_9FIRM|nr:RDD family protein [Syntrophomonas zehnderi]CFX86426.1 RDD [Syntrophomonas zehnderi OL-4]
MTVYDERVSAGEQEFKAGQQEETEKNKTAVNDNPELLYQDRENTSWINKQPAPNDPEVAGVDAALADTGVVMYRAAGFWIRLCAFVVDLIVIAALNAFVWGLLLPVSPNNKLVWESLHINALFLGVTGALYFILMTYYFQQTLGKMIFGIKVVQASGEPLSWITVIFRELVARSLSQIMGLNLGYIVCWFNADKRCVHDFLSDTWVVYEKSHANTGYVAIKPGRL